MGFVQHLRFSMKSFVSRIAKRPGKQRVSEGCSEESSRRRTFAVVMLMMMLVVCCVGVLAPCGNSSADPPLADIEENLDPSEHNLYFGSVVSGTTFILYLPEDYAFLGLHVTFSGGSIISGFTDLWHYSEAHHAVYGVYVGYDEYRSSQLITIFTDHDFGHGVTSWQGVISSDFAVETLEAFPDVNTEDRITEFSLFRMSAYFEYFSEFDDVELVGDYPPWLDGFGGGSFGGMPTSSATFVFSNSGLTGSMMDTVVVNILPIVPFDPWGELAGTEDPDDVWVFDITWGMIGAALLVLLLLFAGFYAVGKSRGGRRKKGGR